MIIGIDLHGVIDNDIEWFKDVLEGLMYFDKYKATTIYIISGPPKVYIEKELNRHGLYQGIHFDGIFSIVDFLLEKFVNMWTDDRGRWWAGDEDWWSSKAKICEEHGVDIMIDDQERYQPYFKDIKTKFLLYTDKGGL